MDPRALLESLQFCIVDLETTGGDVQKDKIIEIGLIRVRGLKIVDKLGLIINPEIPIPMFIQRLTTIKESDTKDAPTIEQSIDQIIEFVGESILVAHNTSFDITFINGVLKKMKRKAFANPILCTNIMTKYLIPEITNSNLPYMCKILKIPHLHAHRAIFDAESTANLLLKYLDFFIERNIKKVNQLYYPLNKFELDKIHLKTEEELTLACKTLKELKSAFIISFKGEKGQILGTIPFSTFAADCVSLAKNFEWETITIKLCGTYFDALIAAHDHYTLLSPKQKQTMLDIMNKKEKVKDVEMEEILKFFDDKVFLITPHLIPEQYILTDLRAPMKNRMLVFKYPSHWNKVKKIIENGIFLKSTKKTKHSTFPKKKFEAVEFLKFFTAS
jgi:DNA polymerase-3 subunit epsilon